MGYEYLWRALYMFPDNHNRVISFPGSIFLKRLEHSGFHKSKQTSSFYFKGSQRKERRGSRAKLGHLHPLLLSNCVPQTLTVFGLQSGLPGHPALIYSQTTETRRERGEASTQGACVGMCVLVCIPSHLKAHQNVHTLMKNSTEKSSQCQHPGAHHLWKPVPTDTHLTPI